MVSFKHFANKFINLLVLLIIIAITITNFSNVISHYFIECIILIITVLAFTAMLYYSAKFLQKQTDDVNQKLRWLNIGLVAILAIAIITIFKVKTPLWGAKVCLTAAQQLVQHHFNWHAVDYCYQSYLFNFYPNNLGLTYFEVIIITILNFLHIHLTTTNLYFLFTLINVLFLLSSMILIIKILKRHFKPYISTFFSWLMVINIPILMMLMWFYTDYFALFTTTLLLYKYQQLLLQKDFKHQIPYFIILGITAWFGTLFKVTVLIVLIAIFIHYVLTKWHLKTIIGLIITMLTIFSLSTVTHLYEQKVDPYPKNVNMGLPLSHWPLMALHSPALYDQQSVNETVLLKQKYSNKQIMKMQLHQEVTDIKHQPQLLVKMILTKLSYTYGNGTYDILSWIDNPTITFVHKNNPIFKIAKKIINYHYFYLFYCTVVLFTNYLLIACGTIADYHESFNFTSIFKLSFIGLFIFLMIWESHSRYLLQFSLINLYLVCDSISHLSLHHRNKKHKKA